ncbi:MAG TPA: hypothetical protein VE466_12015 [Acidimicrobiales bacterium]|nr:hypothetical protein [Acidimicrobiales bacterium]
MTNARAVVNRLGLPVSARIAAARAVVQQPGEINGLSKRGKHSQSTEPARVARAAE